MVTAWSPQRMLRARSDAGPLLRVLAVAVLLFGVLLTHGVHVETVAGHLSTSATTSPVPPADDIRHVAAESSPLFAGVSGDHRGGHEPSHPGQECVSGQPQQGSVLASPCFAASVRESTGAEDASALRVSAADLRAGGMSPMAPRAASLVQQV